MIKITVLGSTGSIGTQVLDVCKRIGNKIQVLALGAQNNADLLIKQVKEFKPKYACIGNENLYNYVKENIPNDIKLVSGEEGFLTLAEIEADKVIISIAGFPGFYPTLRAMELGKTVCLASKEVLVAGGHIVTEYQKKYNVPLLPIDSEHSAIFQCLQGAEKKEIKKLILTASGGAFRDKSVEELEKLVKNSWADFGFAFKEDGNQKYVLLHTDVKELAVARLQPEIDEFLKNDESYLLECLIDPMDLVK